MTFNSIIECNSITEIHGTMLKGGRPQIETKLAILLLLPRSGLSGDHDEALKGHDRDKGQQDLRFGKDLIQHDE